MRIRDIPRCSKRYSIFKQIRNSNIAYNLISDIALVLTIIMKVIIPRNLRWGTLLYTSVPILWSVRLPSVITKQ